MKLDSILWNKWLAVLAAMTLSVSMTACGDDDDDDDDTTPTTTDDDDDVTDDDDDVTNDDDDVTDDDDDDCSDNATETACDITGLVGDVSCAGTNPDPAPGEGTVMVSGVLTDFQAETPVGGASMEVDATGATTTTAPDGSYTLEVPARQRINILVTATGYRNTWQYDVMTEDADYEDNFVIVAESTYRLVPGLWGVTPDPATCVIAGSVSDCAGDSLQGYGITAITEACPHAQAAVKWFKGGFPNGTQCPASDDGLYGVVNVLPPAVSIQVIGEGDEVLLEQGPVPCEAGAIGVFSLQIH